MASFKVVEVQNMAGDYRKKNIRITTNIQETKDEKNTIKILDSLISDKPLKPGSYRGRKNTAPEKLQILASQNQIFLFKI